MRSGGNLTLVTFHGAPPKVLMEEEPCALPDAPVPKGALMDKDAEGMRCHLRAHRSPL